MTVDEKRDSLNICRHTIQHYLRILVSKENLKFPLVDTSGKNTINQQTKTEHV